MLALLSYLCLIKSELHTVLSHVKLRYEVQKLYRSTTQLCPLKQICRNTPGRRFFTSCCILQIIFALMFPQNYVICSAVQKPITELTVLLSEGLLAMRRRPRGRSGASTPPIWSAAALKATTAASVSGETTFTPTEATWLNSSVIIDPQFLLHWSSLQHLHLQLLESWRGSTANQNTVFYPWKFFHFFSLLSCLKKNPQLCRYLSI